MGFGTSGIPPSSSPIQVGYGGGTTLGPGSGPSPGMPPGSGPGMGPPGSMHHHGGMGSPMGPPPSGHHHPGMAPPPPSGPGMSMGPPGMGPPSSAGTSSGTSGPMVVSAPTSIPPTVTVSTPSPLPNSHLHHDGPGPMPPPSSSANSHPSQHSHAGDLEPSHDNGITTTSTGSTYLFVQGVSFVHFLRKYALLTKEDLRKFFNTFNSDHTYLDCPLSRNMDFAH